jgi:hypothetical protein
MQYIRDTYKVPAKRGGRVKFTGNPHNRPQFGTIVGSDGARLRVRMDEEKNTFSYHPDWEIEYLKGTV